jgi:signal peptidase I
MVLNVNQEAFLELSQELLDRGALLRFQAHGDSMYPFIKNGNIIVIEPRNGNAVSTGDVIFYRRTDGLVTAHRLVKINNQNDSPVLTTKGDSLYYFDPPVTGEQVMGRVVLIESQERKLQLTGWTGRVFGRLTACFARGRYPAQTRLVRNMGRLCWLLGGRRLK